MMILITLNFNTLASLEIGKLFVSFAYTSSSRTPDTIPSPEALKKSMLCYASNIIKFHNRKFRVFFVKCFIRT